MNARLILTQTEVRRLQSERDRLLKVNTELFDALEEARDALILANMIDKSNTCEKALAVVRKALELKK